MSEITKNKIESFNKSYGVLFTFLWRFFFYPIIGLIFYSASSYLKENYVSKKYFDSAITKIENGQQDISDKLDGVLIFNAAALQKGNDLEKRVIRLENFRDGNPGKIGKSTLASSERFAFTIGEDSAVAESN